MILPAERQAILKQGRNLKMARSAHAYVRGSTAKFYEWLSARSATLPEGPSVWICGDCHLGNLGPLADERGKVAIQVRDLDQTVIGNPAHDLVRLGLSLASAARGSDLPGVTTAKMVEELVAGYQTALAGNFSDEEDRAYRPKPIQLLLRRSVRRKWRHLAEERLDNVEPRLPLGKKFWTLAREEREALTEMLTSEAARGLLTRLQGRSPDDPVAMADAAYWMKGCSSLGRLRYAALLRIGRGEASSLCLVDIKESVSATAPRARDAKMPRDNAVRVVTGAQALSPHLGGRMLAERLLGRPVVVRELMPQDLKIDIERMTEQEAREIARYLAEVIGHAHGRQMDGATRRAWLADLTQKHLPSLGAPSWLWSSIVELMGLHEAAYLEHCRLFALGEAAQRPRRSDPALISLHRMAPCLPTKGYAHLGPPGWQTPDLTGAPGRTRTNMSSRTTNFEWSGKWTECLPRS